jgi:hypothetical protein
MAAYLQRFCLDRAGIAVAVTGCLATIVDAGMKGRAPLKAETPAGEFQTKQAALTRAQCRTLEQDGYLVMDNFLSKEQVQEARESIQKLDADRRFHASPIEHEQQEDNSVVRTNRIHICRETSGKLDNVRLTLAGFARGIVDSDFSGFDPTYQSGELQFPAHMQVSIYGSKGAAVATHDFFTTHLDSANANSFTSLGLLGWLRSHHLRRRYLTCIVYLNDEWKDGDGGCLRMFKNGMESGELDKTNVIDIPPLAGRLVVFSSLQQWHAVLPTQATRYACSLWLTLNPK